MPERCPTTIALDADRAANEDSKEHTCDSERCVLPDPTFEAILQQIEILRDDAIDPRHSCIYKPILWLEDYIYVYQLAAGQPIWMFDIYNMYNTGREHT